jgi:predicted nucleic acid-binding protein
MKVLADTSVWVDYFRHKNTVFEELLLGDNILTHEMIVGELVCGTPPAPRQQSIALVKNLSMCAVASADEVMHLIEKEKMYGLGVGWVDVCLLSSVLITPSAQLWTIDQRLHKLAQRMGVAFASSLH